jgi:hypothetical protein
VDAAAALLAVEEALGDSDLPGPGRVNTRRCRELLELGRLRGFEPAADAWRRFLQDRGKGESQDRGSH